MKFKTLVWLAVALFVDHSRATILEQDPHDPLQDSNEEFSLTVGSFTYTPPWSRFAYSIQVALHEAKLDDSKLQSAQWLYDLGLAHRTAYETQILEGEEVQDSHHLTLALSRFHLALAKEPHSSLAGRIHFALGESYALQVDSTRALYHYQQAEPLLHGNPHDWASACLRIGETLYSQSQQPSSASLWTLQEALSTITDATLLESTQRLQQFLQESHPGAVQEWKQARKYQKLQEQQAQEWLQKSVDAYRQLDVVMDKELFAQALQLLGTLQKSTQVLQESIQIQPLAETYMVLANFYIEQGLYEASNHAYDDCMDLYAKLAQTKQHRQFQLDVLGDNADIESTIQLLEDSLQEYLSGLESDEFTETEAKYLRDDHYQGDVHSSLGTLYLQLGDDVQAESHFRQALLLYNHDVAAADVHINLSTLLLQRGAFIQSGDERRRALAIYQQVHPQGIDLMAGQDVMSFLQWEEDEQAEEQVDDDGNKEQVVVQVDGSTTDSPILINVKDFLRQNESDV